MLKRFQQAGHRPIALIGGGTGMIGDPSGRTSERTLNDESIVHGYTESIRNQLAGLLNFEAEENAAIARDNNDWRSEEHTSELQSRGHLVCRLLLEKKK